MIIERAEENNCRYVCEADISQSTAQICTNWSGGQSWAKE